jgi:hypothetical protein
VDKDDHGPFRIVQEYMGRLGCGDGHGERSDGGSRGLPPIDRHIPARVEMATFALG